MSKNRGNSSGTKYNAKKVEIDGFLFDSKSEADYYLYLMDLKNKGIIEKFITQPKYLLQPSFEKNGKKFRKIEYIADFEVYYTDGSIEVIDVKGFVTSDFAIKLKMFEFHYQDRNLKLMKFVKKYGGWITFDEWKVFKKEDKKTKKSKT